MKTDKKPLSGRVVALKAVIAKPAKPAKPSPHLKAVVGVVGGYFAECWKVVRPSGYALTHVEKVNEANHVNTMLQACIQLHIATLPGADSCPKVPPVGETKTDLVRDDQHHE
jgi:hypothetical protein